jgi:hypothetical protein
MLREVLPLSTLPTVIPWEAYTGDSELAAKRPRRLAGLLMPIASGDTDAVMAAAKRQVVAAGSQTPGPAASSSAEAAARLA